MYELSDNEFDKIVENLITAGIITRKAENGIIYYDITKSALNKHNAGKKEFASFVVDSIAKILGEVAKNVTVGLLMAN